jgi:acyl dehydratase
MSPLTFYDLAELVAAAPCDLGATGWVTVDGAMVERFVRATGCTPDGLVPPYMLLSLTNLFLPRLLQVPSASSGVNYGTGLVRFGPSVKPGAGLRGRATLVEASETAGGVQTTVRITVDAGGVDQPLCVVDSLSRWFP